MSAPASTEKLQELLNAMYANIVMHATEERLPFADKAFYGIRDYALGDTISCTAEAALRNCEQIKSYFPREVPKSVTESVDNVQAEIRRLDKKNNSNYLSGLFFPGLIVGSAIIIYYVVHHR